MSEPVVWILYVLLRTSGGAQYMNEHPMPSFDVCQAAAKTLVVPHDTSGDENESLVAAYCATPEDE